MGGVFEWVRGLPWRVVFWWKKQTGFIDMRERIEVTGHVLSIDTASDGDRTFNVCLDAGQERYITGFGGRLTSKSSSCPAIHCEIPPWVSRGLKGTYDSMEVGQRVRVTGAWGFDGVHVGYDFFPWEVVAALVRHQPNVRDGWFEIHPVESIELL